MTQTITPEELALILRESPGTEIIDVRTPAEFREVHLVAARNYPLAEFDPKVVLAGRAEDSTAPIYVICHAGARGAEACSRFEAAGITHAINVGGGTKACVAAGLPVVQGKKGVSLERQVRIAAGSLVVVGVLLGVLVHPAWSALAGFIGAGLVFSGVTDTCGMALALARMPWNR
jgi:rhodanese-related sulfurtransferase